MGKRKGYKRKGDKDKGKKQVHTEWASTSIPQQNQIFKNYYQMQLNLPQQQFEIFWQHMKIKLPVVFRVNPNCANYRNFCDKIQSEEFLKSIIPMQQIQKEAKQANEPTEMPKIRKIDFYPNDIVFQLSTSKQMFKKSKILSEFHKYLQKSFDAGLISRQQLVSMLPPLYLNLNQNDVVLDMCAAPGSKTSQMIQIMSGEQRKLIKGCIIANDADYGRAQMLIHQIQRAGTAGIVAVNHPGQFLPQIWAKKINNNSIKQKFQFDKILCDVPCSGDGATRKIPTKWAKWHTSDGMVLHPLQLAILIKAINLLKKGGLLVYSTCSLNPIENQSVICALMQKVECGLELVDIHPMYEVKGRRGMLNWNVCTIADKKKYEKMAKKSQQKMKEQVENKVEQKTQDSRFLKIINNWEQVKDIKNTKIKQTMFPLQKQVMQKMGIQHSMRILPHDQNSGGFFVALFKKHQDFQWKYNGSKKDKKQQSNQHDNQRDQQQENEKFLKQNMPEVIKDVFVQNEMNQNEQERSQSEKSDEQAQKRQAHQDGQQMFQQKKEQIKAQKTQFFSKEDKKKQKGSKYDTYQSLQEEQFASIKQFYGLSDQIKSLLFVRQSGSTKKKVLLITQSLDKFLKTDVNKKIQVVNMGCTAFEKGKQSFAGHHCLYRLTQQGVHFMLDYITKRKVKVALNFFKKVIEHNTIMHQLIQEEQIRNQIKELTQGALVIYIDQVINGKRIVDAMVGQNFKNSFHIMVSKEDLASLSIRYL